MSGSATDVESTTQTKEFEQEQQPISQKAFRTTKNNRQCIHPLFGRRMSPPCRPLSTPVLLLLVARTTSYIFNNAISPYGIPQIYNVASRMQDTWQPLIQERSDRVRGLVVMVMVATAAVYVAETEAASEVVVMVAMVALY